MPNQKIYNTIQGVSEQTISRLRGYKMDLCALHELRGPIYMVVYFILISDDIGAIEYSVL